MSTQTIHLGDEELTPEAIAELRKAVVAVRDAALTSGHMGYAVALSKAHAVMVWAEEQLTKEPRT